MNKDLNTMTKNMFAVEATLSLSLVEQEKVLRQNQQAVLESAAKSIGRILDEINAQGMHFKAYIETGTSVQVDKSEWGEPLSVNEVCTTIGDLNLKFEGYYGRYDHRYFQQSDVYSDICASNLSKKNLRRVIDLIGLLSDVEKQWKSLNISTLDSIITINGENDYIVKVEI